MKNPRKDDISSSGDDTDNNSETSENNGRSISEHPKPSLVSASDRDSEITSANQNSKNRSSSEHLPRTTKGVGQENSVSLQSTFDLDDLSLEDEIYTLQCPSVYNMRDLLNKSIDLTKPDETLTTGTEEFQFELINSEKKFITLAIPKKSSSGGLINLPLKGHLIIQKVVNRPVADLKIKDVHKKRKVVFPQDIKVRHPLLGANWQDHIKMASKVLGKRTSKKHKSIKKEKLPEIEEVKKLKRKKHEDKSSELSTPKKRKKIDLE